MSEELTLGEQIYFASGGTDTSALEDELGGLPKPKPSSRFRVWSLGPVKVYRVAIPRARRGVSVKRNPLRCSLKTRTYTWSAQPANWMG